MNWKKSWFQTEFWDNKFQLRGYPTGKPSSFKLFIVDSATDNLSATILPWYCSPRGYAVDTGHGRANIKHTFVTKFWPYVTYNPLTLIVNSPSFCKFLQPGHLGTVTRFLSFFPICACWFLASFLKSSSIICSWIWTGLYFIKGMLQDNRWRVTQH